MPSVRYVRLKNMSESVYSSGALPLYTSHKFAAKVSFVNLPSIMSLWGMAMVENGFVVPNPFIGKV